MKDLISILAVFACLWGNLTLLEVAADATSGDFGDFGLCTLKFVRIDRDQYYRDVNEALIDINLEQRNGYLVQMVKEGLNITYPNDDEIARDFKVQENCAVTIAFNLTNRQQFNEIWYWNLDSYRTKEFHNLV